MTKSPTSSLTAPILFLTRTLIKERFRMTTMMKVSWTTTTIFTAMTTTTTAKARKERTTNFTATTTTAKERSTTTLSATTTFLTTSNNAGFDNEEADQGAFNKAEQGAPDEAADQEAPNEAAPHYNLESAYCDRNCIALSPVMAWWWFVSRHLIVC